MRKAPGKLYESPSLRKDYAAALNLIDQGYAVQRQVSKTCDDV
jgi:hypothetical protein